MKKSKDPKIIEPKPKLLTWEALRAFALSLNLPNVEDAVSWGQPNLKAHGKLWVWWNSEEHAAVFKSSFEERDFLLEFNPNTFFITPHYRNWPLILGRPDRLDPAWVAANLERVWRSQAKKSFLKKWDDEKRANKCH
ncbi:MmcQ/YjbR family DNA-binding protein [Candidatus Phycosocius spiralis]|uniref:MmcQ/YjbR family DNA-binding protein n=1 Tax=Candidatus Phycosocius spiralis TaxID=2815099 RepID=A0ABQ4PXD0_9PROT|nr:MmcQ/YjbR family DNA-binding protein [Candidatus Phycosocius spiralis]GIU67678.1 hypothetical protein PsB1_1832 [Candidatus Phycosocius spiralis]